MENSKVYCILCGAENNSSDKFCGKCGESLSQQDTELQEYLKEKVTDKVKSTVKDKATDSLLDMLKKFLNSKAYGIIMSLSIITATATAVAGGSGGGITEFEADTPGQFIDGSLHMINVEESTALYRGRYDIYPGPGGSLSQLYVLTDYASVGVDLQVTGDGARVMTLDGDTVGLEQVFTVEGSVLEFHMTEPTMEGGTYESIVKIDSSFGLSYVEHIHNGVRIFLEEYVAPGVLVHRISRTERETDADGNLTYDLTEQFYDNTGRSLSWYYLDNEGVETTREEFVYDDTAGTTARTRYEMGLPTVYELTNADGNPLEEIGYIDGEQYYRYLYEYYPSGVIKSRTAYENAYTGSRRTEYYEDGITVKAYIEYSEDGTVFSEDYYDENGNRIE